MNNTIARQHDDRDPWLRAIAGAMQNVRATVARYFPELVDALCMALAVYAVGVIADFPLPIAVILVGDSGSGKTQVLRFLSEKAADAPWVNNIVYLDSFTPKSFVSHKADVLKEKLSADIDLLPQIRDKTLITPELGQLLKGKRDELLATFGTFARILDGQGLRTASGAHGIRGYQGDYRFRWLAGSTPLTHDALEVMGHVGPRLLMYGIGRERKGIADLARFLASSDPTTAQAECVDAVRALLVALYPEEKR